MNTHIRLLSQEEAHAVYKTQLKRDFPADEVKPWKSIERMWDDGEYYAVGIFEDIGELPPGVDPLVALRGYAFFVEPKDCGACLLDYYAVLPDYRSEGLGGYSLGLLAEYVRLRGRYVLIETEDIAFAENDAQIAERERRDAFYARNSCVRTDVTASVFGVKYVVWCLGTPPDFDGKFSDDSTPDEVDARFEQACEDMRTLYRCMVPGKKFSLFVKIERRKQK